MTAITFDTLSFMEQLTDAGVPEPHARAEAVALGAIFAAQYQDLTTKGDLRQLEANINHRIDATKGDLRQLEANINNRIEATKGELEVSMDRKFEAIRGNLRELETNIEVTKGDIRELELRMDNKIEAAKSDMIKWMVGIALAQTALLIGLFLKLS